MKREMRELTPRELLVLRKRGLNPPSGPVEVITVFDSRDPVEMMGSNISESLEAAKATATDKTGESGSDPTIEDLTHRKDVEG